jgi:hypothetical protein
MVGAGDHTTAGGCGAGARGGKMPRGLYTAGSQQQRRTHPLPHGRLKQRVGVRPRDKKLQTGLSKGHKGIQNACHAHRGTGGGGGAARGASPCARRHAPMPALQASHALALAPTQPLPPTATLITRLRGRGRACTHRAAKPHPPPRRR